MWLERRLKKSSEPRYYRYLQAIRRVRCDFCCNWKPLVGFKQKSDIITFTNATVVLELLLGFFLISVVDIEVLSHSSLDLQKLDHMKRTLLMRYTVSLTYTLQWPCLSFCLTEE